jgi:hypothetical protein
MKMAASNAFIQYSEGAIFIPKNYRRLRDSPIPDACSASLGCDRRRAIALTVV